MFKITGTREPYLMLGGDVLFLGEIPRTTSFEKGMPNTYYEDKDKEIKDNIEAKIHHLTTSIKRVIHAPIYYIPGDSDGGFWVGDCLDSNPPA